MSVKIGKAKPQGGSYAKKPFSLKDGDNVYMILPPLGDLADKGQWNVYHAVHWGYKNSSGSFRPFLSTEKINYKTKMVEVPDAALDRLKKLDTDYKAAVIARNIDEAKRLKSLQDRYSLDKKFYVNAMTLDGQLGILKIPYKSMLALAGEKKDGNGGEMGRQKASGVDIMDVENGRFMVFRRSGTSLDTVHQVLTYKEKIKVEGLGEVEKEKVAKLDEAALGRLATEVSLNLTKMYKSISAEEVALVVEADMNDDLSVIDSILGGSVEASAPVETTEEVDDIPENKPAPAAKAAVAAVKGETKTEVKVAKTTTVAPKTTSVSDMSEDEFMAMLEKP